MDVPEQQLTQALKAYRDVGLIRIENRDEEVFIAFSTPTDRAVRDFIIHEYKHIGRPVLEKK